MHTAAMTMEARAPDRHQALVDRLTTERQRHLRTIADLEEMLSALAAENVRLRTGAVLRSIPCPTCGRDLPVDRATRADGQVVDYRVRCRACDLRIDASGIGEDDARGDLRTRWAKAREGVSNASQQ